LLQKTQRNNGIRSDYVWMRFHHIFSLPLLALARKCGLTEVQHYARGKASYHHFDRVKPMAIAYRYLLLVDTFIAVMVKIFPRLALGRTVICDRFVYDTLVDLMLSTSDRNVPDYITTRLLLSLASNSKTVVMMDDQTRLRARRENVRLDRNLASKIELYNALSARFGLPILSAEGSILDVHRALLKILDS